MSKEEKLYVYFEMNKVGELHKDDQAVYSFQYTKEWLSTDGAFSLSLHLPLGEKKFGNKSSLSFFENLLPEGEMRNFIESSNKLEGSFQFLKEYGKDCAGAIEVLRMEKKEIKEQKNSFKKIDKKDLYVHIYQRRPIAEVILKEKGYLSIAGAQDKFATRLEKEEFLLPLNGQATTHIVKAPIQHSGIKESVYNEYFCMKLAQKIGLSVSECSIMKGEYPLYITKRFDRMELDQHLIKRIHQQDFCQAQGILSENKYEVKGGPNIKENYSLILEYIGAKNKKRAIESYLDWLAFNLIIGNNDCHSKNISILHQENLALAPFYDLICTKIYPKLTKDFAFSIGGEFRPDKMALKNFQQMELEMGIGKNVFVKRFNKLSLKIEKEMPSLLSDLKKEYPDAKIMDRISDLIFKTIKGFKMRGM